MVILRNGLDHEDDDDEGVDDDQESDSDSGLGGSVPPCSVTFVGANVSTGKSSMRSKSRDKKVSHLYFHTRTLLLPVMPEGEKIGAGAVVINGDNLPSPGWNRLN